MYKTEGFCCGE